VWVVRDYPGLREKQLREEGALRREPLVDEVRGFCPIVVSIVAGAAVGSLFSQTVTVKSVSVCLLQLEEGELAMASLSRRGPFEGEAGVQDRLMSYSSLTSQ
jgi:hypothetical protein